MHRGYIKLWRKITDWGWYKDSNTLSTFIHLLLKANHKDTTFRGHLIPRGSCVCGVYALAEDTGLTPQSIRTAINHLISTKDIAKQSTNRFSIISIANYDSYQGENDNQTTNNQQTTNKQLTTSKECKEYKNNTSSLADDAFNRFWGAYPRKTAKGAAERAFRGALKLASIENILSGLKKFKFSEDPQYIPHPATWLNQRRWEDEHFNSRREDKPFKCVV